MPTAKFEEFVEEVLQSATHLRSLFDARLDKLRHALIGNTEDGSTDIQGRMQITEAHRAYAGIESKSDIVIVGVGEWCEIWSLPHWEAYEKGLDSDSVREAGLFVDNIWEELSQAQQNAGVSHTGSDSADTDAA
jgi:DNA-binding transcriptional regulator/RsmH inhibitor MraZ